MKLVSKGSCHLGEFTLPFKITQASEEVPGVFSVSPLCAMTDSVMPDRHFVPMVTLGGRAGLPRLTHPCLPTP